MTFPAERLGRSCPVLCVILLATPASADQSVSLDSLQISAGARVFSQSCLPCHGANSPSALDLTDPIELHRKSPTAAKIVREGVMPPWLPSEMGAPLMHSRKLSDVDRTALLEWLDHSGPGKVPATEVLPPPSQNCELIVRVAENWRVGADPGLTLRSFALSRDHAIDRHAAQYFNAVELVADAPGLVHGISFLWDELGYGARLDASDPAPGYDAVGDIGLNASGSGGGVSRLSTLWRLPKGYAIEIPTDAVLIAEVHAEGRGKVESPAATVRFLAPTEPFKPVHAVSVSAARVAMIATACEAVSISIRAGAHVKSIDVFAKDANGHSRCVLNIPRWNEALSEPWIFDPPLALDAGTELFVRSTVNEVAKDTLVDANASAMNQPMIVLLVADKDADLIREK